MIQNLKVTEATPKHFDFIYATWLKSFRYGSYFAKKIKNEIFFKHHHIVVENILSHKDTSVLVASIEDDPDLILGYLVMAPKIIHYIYVKDTFRNFGVARSLFKSNETNLNECQFTHWTFACDDFMGRFIRGADGNKLTAQEPKWPGLSYNPYLGSI